jgi:hypothetical protein
MDFETTLVPPSHLATLAVVESWLSTVVLSVVLTVELPSDFSGTVLARSESKLTTLTMPTA